MATDGSRYVGGVFLAVVTLAALWLLVPSPTIADHPASSTGARTPPDTSPFVQQLAVPAYVNPVTDQASWSQLSESRPGRVGIIVANVANGPGAAPEPAWTDVIHRSRASGGRVLGYVDTGYLGTPSLAHPDGLPTRTGQYGPEAWLSQVQADIDAWYRFYGADVGGIFLDQATSACGPRGGSNQYADRYRELRTHLLAVHPGALTVLNPGMPVPRCYSRAADVLVTFEGSYANYTAVPDRQGRDYEPLGWTPEGPGQIWHIVYGASSSEQMEHAMTLSHQRRAGYVYVTDGGLPNPFGTLPPTDYWTAEQVPRTG